VTIYNVTCGVSGLTETPIVTVPTDASGNFTASFNWCSPLCWWPCWPLWWHCWPWWWELDILAVIENIERQLHAEASGVANPAAPLRQPNGADLMTGLGFVGSRNVAAVKPDPARTALIATKFADPRIVDRFPWRWWCCDNPNIVFSATQGTTVILNEDPNTETRWCFASGQTVALMGNAEALGACSTGTNPGPDAFAWTSVGSEPPDWVLVDDISMGYANGSPGTAASNAAFAGTLNLNGVISGANTAFYQVLAGQWAGNGNPARGGTAPSVYQPLAMPLVNYVSIWRAATSTVETDAVVLGPCSFNGQDNLYMTLSQRQNAPASVVTQLGAFPTVTAPDFVIGWAAPDLILSVAAGNLVAGTSGGVSLALNPFDISGNPLPVPPYDMGAPLTLMIDTTPLTTATIDSVAVFNSDGTSATVTSASSTECPAYQITTPGGGYVQLHVTVTDGEAHLYQYAIQTQYGSGSYLPATPSDRDYGQAPASFTPPSPPTQLYGVDPGYQTPDHLPLPPPPPASPAPSPTAWTYVGGGDTIYLQITQSCCYDFQLWAGKRVTDGETFFCTYGNVAFQTVNIVVAS